MISLFTNGFQYPQAELAPPSLAFNKLCTNVCTSLLPTGLQTQDYTWILGQKIMTVSRITSLLGEIKECQGSILCFLAANQYRKTEAEGRKHPPQHSFRLANFSFPFLLPILSLWALPTEGNRIGVRQKQNWGKETVEEVRVLVMQQNPRQGKDT